MNKKIDIRWEELGGIYTATGVMTRADIDDLAVIDHNDEESVTAKYIIVDVLNADFSNIKNDDIAVVIAHDIGFSNLNPELNVAIVTVDEHTLSLVSHYLSEMSKFQIDWDIRVFSSMKEARKWVQSSPTVLV